MGGYGSGRHIRSARLTTEFCRQIDSNQQKRSGSIRPDVHGLTLATGQPVKLEWQQCRYGGHRVWFHCPKCDRRCVKLYFRRGLYRCRQCSDLTYSSSQTRGTIAGDLVVAARRLSQALGDREWLERFENEGPEWADLFPPTKPKWMRWSTYDKHWGRYQSAVQRHREKFRTDLRQFVSRLK